jgi:hypothetical protein
MVESGRAHCLACTQAKAGMMPGAAYGIANYDAFAEWTMIMRAAGANRE